MVRQVRRGDRRRVAGHRPTGRCRRPRRPLRRRLARVLAELAAAGRCTARIPPDHDAGAIVRAPGRPAGPPAPRTCARLDAAREAAPDWFQAPDMLGYVFYVDRFAGTLRGVLDHVGYLDELGVRYVHLMPLLTPRDGDNDGGYAVADYDAVRPDLGTMDDLEARGGRAAGAGHEHLHRPRGQPHRGRAPLGAGGGRGRSAMPPAYYRIFPDRTEPDRWERDAARGLPGLRPRQLHPAARRTLGLDDLQPLAVGPRLVATRGCSRRCLDIVLALADAGHRRLPARRRRVHVEAPGHELPEPARGPPDPARAARVRRGSRPPRSSSRPRRSSARTTWRRTSAWRRRACRPAASATSPTTTASWSSSGRASPRATRA